jgi:hypothetical protein
MAIRWFIRTTRDHVLGCFYCLLINFIAVVTAVAFRLLLSLSTSLFFISTLKMEAAGSIETLAVQLHVVRTPEQ